MSEENKSLTLYEQEDWLATLIDTEDDVQPDQDQEFQIALKSAIESAVEKRDAVCRFIGHCESQAEFARQEGERLALRAQMFDRAAERLKAYVVKVIRELPVDQKGKFRKLIGETSTMRIQKNPKSVAVKDEVIVAADAKRITVTLWAPDWDAILGHVPEAKRNLILNPPDGAKKPRISVEISKTVLAQLLELGPVDGAEWAEETYHLRRS